MKHKMSPSSEVMNHLQHMLELGVVSWRFRQTPVSRASSCSEGSTRSDSAKYH